MLLALVPAATAQQSPIEKAADQIAGRIIDSRQTTLAVFDFSGPGNPGRIAELGRKLSDDLIAAIGVTASRIHVVDRALIEEKRREGAYEPEVVVDFGAAWAFARELGAQSFVVGQLSEEKNNTVTLDLQAFRADTGKKIATTTVSIPLNDDLPKLMTQDIPRYKPPEEAAKSFPEPSYQYSQPSCIYCPRADYSPEALETKVQGTVELGVVITEDGSVTDVTVRKGLPGGLTAEAIAVVKRWRLNPSKGPDGKPLAVRDIVEVTFQL